jgi:probable HAF family extracellular repeat protein
MTSSASQLRTSLLLLILLLPAGVFSQPAKTKFVSGPQAGFAYTSFQVPGSSYTVGLGVNNLGDIVGSFVSNGVQSGFLYTAGVFQTIACPGASFTIAQAINDSGVIVGWCGFGKLAQGFIYQNGIYSYVNYPKAKLTALEGINNQGEIVGVFQIASTSQHSFYYSNGTFTALGAKNSNLSAINNVGMIAGSACVNVYQCNALQGVVYVKGPTRWKLQKTVNYPGASGTVLNGINDNADLAGDFGPTANGQQGGFVYIESTNTFVGFDIQNSTDMAAEGINNSGEVVGYYTVGTTFYGFYGRVSQ